VLDGCLRVCEFGCGKVCLSVTCLYPFEVRIAKSRQIRKNHLICVISRGVLQRPGKCMRICMGDCLISRFDNR
jgi:hypothetical protein